MKKIGQYTLGKELGKGAFGLVRLAVNEQGESFAIKVISLKEVKQQKLSQQVKREISIMKLINHKNVVKLIEVLKSEEHLFIVCELALGGELFDVIVSKGRLQEDEARRYFTQMVDALVHVHAHQVAHRDLKLENILLSQDDQIKITDFGLSKIKPVDNSDVFSTVVGTMGYACPTLLSGLPYDGFAADVWSLAVVLYVMLAGYLPFEETNVSVLFRRTKNSDYEIPEHFSKDVTDLIKSILIADASKRPTIKQVAQHKWLQSAVEIEETVIPVSIEQLDRLPAIMEEEEEEVEETEKPKKALITAMQSIRIGLIETKLPPPAAIDKVCDLLTDMGFETKRFDQRLKLKALKGGLGISVQIFEGSSVQNVQIRLGKGTMSGFATFHNTFRQRFMSTEG